MTPEQVQQTRIEAAVEAFFADWRENDITDTPDYARAIGVAMAAADGVALPLVYEVDCAQCGGTGGFHPDDTDSLSAEQKHVMVRRCEPCRGEGQVLVLASCGTCGGKRKRPGTAGGRDHGLDGWNRCPDCSDGTMRRRLLELLGGIPRRHPVRGHWLVPESGDE